MQGKMCLIFLETYGFCLPFFSPKVLEILEGIKEWFFRFKGRKHTQTQIFFSLMTILWPKIFYKYFSQYLIFLALHVNIYKGSKIEEAEFYFNLNISNDLVTRCRWLYWYKSVLNTTREVLTVFALPHVYWTSSFN